jgi:hypothetical protein
MTALCFDCGVDTLTPGRREYGPHQPGRGDFYMVHNDVWKQAGLPDKNVFDVLTLPRFSSNGREHKRLPGMFLCIGCLEVNIGCQLVRADFTNAPINRMELHSTGWHSLRLRSRLLAERQSG